MAEFEPITTQEALDKIVSEAVEKYADYDTISADLAAQTQTVGELTALVDAEKQKTAAAELKLMQMHAALDAGLPHGLASRLAGSTESEIAEDAKALARLLTPSGVQGRSAEPGISTDNRKAETMSFLHKLTGRE